MRQPGEEHAWAFGRGLHEVLWFHVRSRLGLGLALAAIFGVALGLRCWSLVTYQALDFRVREDFYREEAFSPLLVADSWGYLNKAKKLLDEGELGPPFQPPVTFLIVAAGIAVMGEGIVPLKVLWCVMSALAAALTAVVGMQMASRGVGLLAGGLVALSFTQIPLAIGLTAEAPQTLLLMGFLATLLALAHRPSWRWGLAHGAICVGCQLNRSEFLLGMLACWLWLILYRRDASARVVAALAVACSPLAAGVGAWSYRNYLHASQVNAEKPYDLPLFIPTTLNGPPNFFIGNNPFANGGFTRSHFGGTALNPSLPRHREILLEGYRLGWEWISENPEAWGRLALVKLWRFGRALGYGYGRGNLGHGLTGPLEPGEPLFPQSIGLFWVHSGLLLLGAGRLLWKRVWQVIPVLLIVLVGAGVNVAFFGMARSGMMHYPLAALLMAGLLHGWELPLGERWRAWFPVATLLLATTGLVAGGIGLRGETILLRRRPNPLGEGFFYEPHELKPLSLPPG